MIDIAEGIALVEIAHIGVYVAVEPVFLHGIVAYVAPHLRNDILRAGQAGVPCHDLAAVSRRHTLAEAYEALGIGHSHLVATYVYHGTKLCRYLLKKLFEAGLKHLHALLCGHAKTKSAVKVCAVAGHVDFGKHHDTTLLGIGYHVAYLRIGVYLATVAPGLLIGGVVELRIDTALNSPRGIVGEMPVKDIELVERHEVDVALYHVYGAVVAPRVVHEAPQRKGRIVLDAHHRHVAVLVGELSECLPRPHESAAVLCPYDGLAFLGN